MARTFLGYAVFHSGKPFPSSGNTVTRDRLYLKACALLKLNKITKVAVHFRGEYADKIGALWRADRELSLRRVYAEGGSDSAMRKQP